MTDALLKLLGSALSIWESKESRKYIDRFLELKKDYYEEDNKPRPDMAKLDNIRHELRLLADVVSGEISNGLENIK